MGEWCAEAAMRVGSIIALTTGIACKMKPLLVRPASNTHGVATTADICELARMRTSCRRPIVRRESAISEWSPVRHSTTADLKITHATLVSGLRRVPHFVLERYFCTHAESVCSEISRKCDFSIIQKYLRCTASLHSPVTSSVPQTYQRVWGCALERYFCRSYFFSPPGHHF